VQAGSGQPAVGAIWFIRADQLAAIGAQNRFSFGGHRVIP